jgi:hypothetical protein
MTRRALTPEQQAAAGNGNGKLAPRTRRERRLRFDTPDDPCYSGDMPNAIWYAASVARTGVYGFTFKSERDAWIAEHDGFVVPASHVDHEIHRQMEGAG